MKPSRRRDTAVQAASDGETRKLQARIDSLEKDLAAERARNDDARIGDAGHKVSRSGNRRWHLFPRH
jgi:hypothetical protein